MKRSMKGSETWPMKTSVFRVTISPWSAWAADAGSVFQEKNVTVLRTRARKGIVFDKKVTVPRHKKAPTLRVPCGLYLVGCPPTIEVEVDGVRVVPTGIEKIVSNRGKAEKQAGGGHGQAAGVVHETDVVPDIDRGRYVRNVPRLAVPGSDDAATEHGSTHLTPHADLEPAVLVCDRGSSTSHTMSLLLYHSESW